MRVTEAGESGAAAAKALNLEPPAGRSTEAGCDSCGHVTRGKGGSVNSKATHTGRPKSRSCNGELYRPGSRGPQPLCSLQSH